MVGRRALILAALISVIAIAVFIFFDQRRREADDNLIMAGLVTAKFDKAGSLKVGSLSGKVTAVVTSSRGGGLLNASWTTKAPYTVDYFVDVSKLTLADYRWDSEKRLLSVRIPQVTVGQVNIDEARRVGIPNGPFITRGAMIEMAQKSSSRSERLAALTAGNPTHVQQARENAKSVIANLLQVPLKVAGRGDVTVSVRFTGESDPRQPWDESTSLAEVFAKD